MARISYQPKKFSPAHRNIIGAANVICGEYATQGLTLTLRQLYYQFVARDLLPNRQQEYKRLGGILTDARMAGEMDWDYLIDRTRNLVAPPHWASPADMIARGAESYRTDLWAGQHQRVHVWVEKDAAIGVIEGTCDLNSVPYFSCRGYTSVSEAWSAAQRIRYDIENGDQVTILHIGDHDPSGLDMSRDIEERLRLFIVRDWLATWGQRLPRPVTTGAVKAHMREHMRRRGSGIADAQPPWRIKRIALNRDQVDRYRPPPNPAKTTDARFQRYVDETGLTESWELDALDPVVLQGLIQDEIDQVRDGAAWAGRHAAMEDGRATLTRLSQQWEQVQQSLRPEGNPGR
jgi:hypothetical protein